MQGFHEVEHKGDVALEIFAETLDQLFFQAVRAFYSVLLPDIDWERRKKSGRALEITVKEDTAESALISLLNELNFLFSVKKIMAWPVERIFLNRNSFFEIKMVARRIKVPLDWLANATEIKAVTYHEVHIEHQAGQYKVRLIFDL